MRTSAAAPGTIRRTGGYVVALVVVALALLNFEIARPPTVATFLRCGFSLGAVAIVLFARTTLVRRALVAVALETAGSIFAFALVDVPFIDQHRMQIGQYAQALYCRCRPGARLP